MPDVSAKPPQPDKPPMGEIPKGLSEPEKIKILRERVKVLRDGALFDQGRIKKPNPAKQYCWVNTREERQTFYQAMGWEVTRDPDIGTLFWKKDENQHRRADLVLYQIDRDLFYALEAEKILRNLDLTGEAADEAFALEMRKHGARLYKPPVT